MDAQAAQATRSGTILARRLARIAPGLPALLRYERTDFPHDLAAGLSVAAIALPVGIAYAQLAGFNPAVGLYASILPPRCVCLVRHLAPAHRRSRCGHLRHRGRSGRAPGRR